MKYGHVTTPDGSNMFAYSCVIKKLGLTTGQRVPYSTAHRITALHLDRVLKAKHERETAINSHEEIEMLQGYYNEDMETDKRLFRTSEIGRFTGVCGGLNSNGTKKVLTTREITDSIYDLELQNKYEIESLEKKLQKSDDELIARTLTLKKTVEFYDKHIVKIKHDAETREGIWGVLLAGSFMIIGVLALRIGGILT